MDNLIIFLLLAVLSVINGIAGSHSDRKGIKSRFSWWASGFVAMGALHHLMRVLLGDVY
jgi:hypothetical protein